MLDRLERSWLRQVRLRMAVAPPLADTDNVVASYSVPGTQLVCPPSRDSALWKKTTPDLRLPDTGGRLRRARLLPVEQAASAALVSLTIWLSDSDLFRRLRNSKAKKRDCRTVTLATPH